MPHLLDLIVMPEEHRLATQPADTESIHLRLEVLVLALTTPQC